MCSALGAVALQAWTRVNPTVYTCMQKLCEDPSTTVIIFSGADKGKLEETFGELDIWLAAENGMFMRPPPSSSGSSKVSVVLSCMSGIGWNVAYVVQYCQRSKYVCPLHPWLKAWTGGQ